ncbi:hypothetical protein [Bradyrhizobium oligotrophicum]|nr:hypothetical protein [Bradyrhizobium oligotrophicum]
MILTAVFKLCGQCSGGPIGVLSQSNCNISPASSLPPAKSRTRSATPSA